MDITSHFDSLGANDATFVDIPECGDTLAAEGFPSSNDLCVFNDKTFPKPSVGMEFDSLENAYLFYNEYARLVGFSIRRAKNRRSNIDGELLFQRFCCSKEGQRRKRRENDDGTKVKDGVVVKVRRRNVKSIRVGCSAKLDVKRSTSGRWVIQKFDEEHNHDYANQGEKHLLRSQRRLQGDATDMRSKQGVDYFCGGDAYLTAKRNMEIILCELEKVAEEDMTITHPDIEDIRSMQYPVEVNNLGSSNHLVFEDNQTFSSTTNVTMQNPPGISDKRTGFWLRETFRSSSSICKACEFLLSKELAPGGKVVDNDYKVLGGDALRVIAGSTLQHSPGTNPQATVMMLGSLVYVVPDSIKQMLETYIAMSIKDGSGCLFLRCPEDKCSAIAGDELFDALATYEDKLKYCWYLVRFYVKKDVKWCLASGCKYAVEAGSD
ncbi:Far1-related sequence 5-like [Thalictrum thalictroides]|uniref:Far1-related sequence 5-like n=1 Tax=Thalictrum thalictroides TaxID=46969 RepID=A0A7J6WY94_THATH|nr:Far1-related sequence 5-like [Thalictrum thalictroides]